MNWAWIIAGLLVLVALAAIAAIYEAWIKRATHRPLSSHAINQRRWDDPNRPDESHQVVRAETGIGRQGLSGIHEYRVSKDPAEQARMLMPDKIKKRK